MEQQRTPPQAPALIRTYAMPADTNSMGKIFGGWIMSQFDIAGGLLAADTARGAVVTVAADKMVFLIPVNVGDIVACHGEIVRIGNTSVTVRLEMWTRKPSQSDSEQKLAAEALYTYVAIDADGIPRQIAAA